MQATGSLSSSSAAGALRSASFDARQAFDTVRIRSALVSNCIEQTRLEHSLALLAKASNRHIRLIDKDIRSVLSGWNCTRTTSGYSNRTRPPAEEGKQLAQPCFMYGERLASRRVGMNKEMASAPTSSAETRSDRRPTNLSSASKSRQQTATN